MFHCVPYQRQLCNNLNLGHRGNSLTPGSSIPHHGKGQVPVSLQAPGMRDFACAYVWALETMHAYTPFR